MLRTILKYRFWVVLACHVALFTTSSTVAASQWMFDTGNTLADPDEIFYSLETSRTAILLATTTERSRLNLADSLVPVFQGQANLFFKGPFVPFFFRELPGSLNRLEYSVLPIRAPPADLF